jgi:hypothetical protein
MRLRSTVHVHVQDLVPDMEVCLLLREGWCDWNHDQINTKGYMCETWARPAGQSCSPQTWAVGATSVARVLASYAYVL